MMLVRRKVRPFSGQLFVRRIGKLPTGVPVTPQLWLGEHDRTTPSPTPFQVSPYTLNCAPPKPHSLERVEAEMRREKPTSSLRVRPAKHQENSASNWRRHGTAVLRHRDLACRFLHLARTHTVVLYGK